MPHRQHHVLAEQVRHACRSCSLAYATQLPFNLVCTCRKLGSSADVGPKLRRGYQEPTDGAKSQQVDAKAEAADDAAAQQPVERLVFVVHGIGQNLSGASCWVSLHLFWLKACHESSIMHL